MRYTTALVVPRHKPNVLETRLTMMDRIAYQPEYSPVRDLQPSSLKNPSNLFTDMPMKSTEDALIQEISKKYILIPKLRTTFINSHNNIWNDTAGQIHNTDKLPERRPKQDTVPINDLKLNPSENADWKDKYEILNILKNEEKEKQSENTFAGYKEGLKHFARTESFLENNQIPINYDRDRTEAMKVTEIPEKDLPNDKLFYGMSDTSQQKLDANTIENEDVTKPDHTVIIGGKIKSITLDYEPEAKEKSDVSEETTEDSERTQLPNLNMSQKYEPQQTNNNLSMSRNYEPQDATNLSIGQNYESQNATNLSMSQNYEPHDASNLSMSQNYEPHDATNLSMSQKYAPQDETNLNVIQTYEQHNATNLSMSQYEPQPESDVNIIAPATLNDEGNYVTEENAYYQEEYAVEGDSSNIQNDSISALQHEDTVYTDSNEVGPTTISDHNIAETLDVTNAENIDVNYIEPAYEQPGTTLQPLESTHQESELANEEQPNNFADMTESIQEFDTEQGGMFVTESVEHYPSQQGDETTALDYAANEYAQNEAYNYYENAQPEAYPVELNNDEMTQQYDPLYEQQYAGVEEQVEGQAYQQYQESEVVEQPEQAGVMQYDQQFMNQGMIEKDLDAEDGYAQQQNDFVVQPDAELVQDNEFVNQEPIKLSEPVRT